MSSGPNVGVMIDGASFTATGFAGRYRCPQTSRRPANHPHTERMQRPFLGPCHAGGAPRFARVVRG